MPEPLGFAIIGCGVIAPQHARAIAALRGRARLVVALDPDADRVAAFVAEVGGRAATDLDDVLGDSAVDAVAICTPTGFHADLAVRALDAGRHVVVEKPIDVDLRAADRLVTAAAAADRTVTVISQHRFDDSSRRVHEAVVSGELGRLTSGVASVSWWRSQGYYDSGDWRGTWALDGGGALMNQSVHTLDLLVWLLGDPVAVTAVAGRLAHERIEVEDTIVATATFASGALGVVHATTAAYPGLSARLQVLGSRGSAVIDDDQLVYLHIGSAGPDAPIRGAGPAGNQLETVPPVLSTGALSKGYTGADPAALSDAHTFQYGDFLDAMETGREPLVTAAEARRSLATILAIYESARHGGQPTTIRSHTR